MLKRYKKSDVRVTSTDPRHHDLAENSCNFDDSILQPPLDHPWTFPGHPCTPRLHTPAHLHTCTLAHLDTWTPAHLNTWTPGHLDTWTPAHLHTCTPAHLDTWTPGHLDTWTPGHLDTWTPGHLDTWTAGHLDIFFKTQRKQSSQNRAKPNAGRRPTTLLVWVPHHLCDTMSRTAPTVPPTKLQKRPRMLWPTCGSSGAPTPTRRATSTQEAIRGLWRMRAF